MDCLISLTVLLCSQVSVKNMRKMEMKIIKPRVNDDFAAITVSISFGVDPYNFQIKWSKRLSKRVVLSTGPIKLGINLEFVTNTIFSTN